MMFYDRGETMGKKYSNQIASGTYPSKESFKKYYIDENHSIAETADNFHISTIVVKNLIVYFNLHKDREASISTCARKRVENRKYPSSSELLSKYAEFGKSWVAVAQYYGYAKITLDRLKKRYGLVRVISPVLLNKDLLLAYIKDNEVKSVSELADKLGVGVNKIYYWAEKHGIVEQISKIASYPEEEIKKLLNKNVLKKDRSVLRPLEIDLFNKEKKIGIEYNGVFWHSEKHKEKDYHFNKSVKAENKGVYLIHVFEDEWIKKNREGIENFLIHSFAKGEEKEYKNLYVKEVARKEEKLFNVKNHYNGHEKSDICLGLYGNELLQLISFKKISDNSYSIVRDYPELNNLVKNGYEKILNYFKEHYSYNNLVVQSDFNKYNGELYEQLGFELVCYTGPQKKAIDSNFKNNYTVYDSGKKVYILKKEVLSYD